jgi:LysM repeat protein
VVRRGDSLWSIARKHDVRVKDLRTWNDLGNDTLLHPGQSLRIVR